MNIYLETAEKLRKLGINETKMSQEQLSKNGGMRALRSMWGGIYEVERGAMKYSFLYFIGKRLDFCSTKVYIELQPGNALASKAGKELSINNC